MKTLLCLFALVSLPALADFADVQKAGKLKVAVDTTYPPMEFEGADGKIVGLDVDLANEVAKKLGVGTEFVVMPWDGILAGLTSNRYDVIMSSMNITAERAKAVNFVEYLRMGQVFVVKKGAAAVKKETDLSGKVIAVQADTTSSEAVESFKKKGVEVKDVKQFKGATETFGALKAGQAEVIVIDEAVGRYYAGMDSKAFEITGQALAPEPIGVAVRKTDKELLAKIQKAVGEIQKEGTFAKIYKQWLKTEPPTAKK